jgi:hypothetical protein
MDDDEKTVFANGYNVDDLSTPRRYFKVAAEGEKLILVDIGSIREPTMLFVEKPGREDLNRTEYTGDDVLPQGPDKPLEKFAYFVPTHRFAPKSKKSNTKKSKPKKSKSKKSKSKKSKSKKSKSKKSKSKKSKPKRSLNKKSSDKRKLAGYERFLHTQMKLMKDDPKSDKEKMALIRKLHTLIN